MHFTEDINKWDNLTGMQHILLNFVPNAAHSISPGQGYNARKVISEVYASFVLQCTVSGR